MQTHLRLHELTCLLFSLLYGLTSSGKIIPDKTLPITVSSTNALKNAEYNFTMKLETNTIPGCLIEILFPEQQYIDGLGLDYAFVAYSPYGTQVPASVSGKRVKVEPGYRDNMTDIIVTVKGVKNPSKVGGTGLFKVYYTCNDNVVDLCENFASIAVTNPVTKLFESRAMVETGSSDVAGDLTNYLILVRPTNDLSKNSVFRVTFPSYYNFTYIKNLVEDFPSENPCEVVPDPSTGFVLSGNITCKFSLVKDNVIEWVGNNVSIPKKSNIWLRLKNVYNPPREMDTDFLTVEVNLKNTNFTYEYEDAVNGLYIRPGPVQNFLLTPVLQLPLEKLKTYDFYMSFTPTSSFSTMRIVTRFRGINTCVVNNGMLPVDANSKVLCTINSNVLEISGIQQYNRKYKTNADKITIKVNAKTPSESGTQIPFEIYTYQTTYYTIKVDQDVASLKTIMQISVSRTLSSRSAHPGLHDLDLHQHAPQPSQHHRLHHRAATRLRGACLRNHCPRGLPSAVQVRSELAEPLDLQM